jgi:serine/threonine protein kinase
MGLTPNYLDPGTELAGYRIESMIARGGMGVVYRALDVQLSRPVALKLLAPELAANDKFRQRFVRESRLAASVDHPNILPIYGAGESSGLLYIAMRYVRGTDLKEELDARGALPLTEVMRILADTASALDAAHAAGLVHRDIKPGNILLSDDRTYGHRHVYLTDFGLTKRATSATGVTTAGHFLGTLDYVAPEQIRGDDVDNRADVYALACVAYTLLAGHPPFEHDDDSAQLWAHMTEEPPFLCAERPELPSLIGVAIQAGMAKKRDDRPASCGGLIGMMDPVPSLRAQPPRDAPRGSAGSMPDTEYGITSRATGEASTHSRRPARSWLPGLALRPGRAWMLGSMVAVFIVILVAVLVIPQLPSGDERVPFSSKGVPYTLEVPKSWTPRLGEGGNSTVSVLSAADVTALFADESDALAAAARTVVQDPASVVGLTIYHQTSILSGQPPSARVGAAEALLPGREARLVDRGARPIGEVEGQCMEGTLPLSSSVTLQVRVCVLETDPSQLLVFFAPPSLFEKKTAVFDQVANSLHRTR